MKKALLPLLVLALSAFAFAGTQNFSINFEQYSAYTQIDNQYSGQYATFSNALQLVAPFYNYFEYPAHSGSGVITNDPLDPIQVNFATAPGTLGVNNITGWYTDPNGVTVNAYNSKGVLVGTFNGAPVDGSNLQFSLSTAMAGTIAYITISDNGGNPDNETVDDISYQEVPEPDSLLIVCSGLLGAVGLFRLRTGNLKHLTGRFRSVLPLLAAVAFVLTFSLASNAEAKRALITQKIDESQLTTLSGNTRPEANAMNDRGPVSADLQFDHMLLLLKRSPESEREVEQFIEDQHNPKSANFHKWLGAEEFGQRYGLVDSDISKLTGWLESYGFKVEYVYLNHMVIDFSGTASQIENAFHTQIRNYQVKDEDYVANASNPRIPSALANAVVGPIYLNNFQPRAMHEQVKAGETAPKSEGGVNPDYTTAPCTSVLPSVPCHSIVPWDLAKIYNIAPLLNAGISGQGTKIVVVEDTNLWNCNSTNHAGNTPGTPCSSTSDWAVFRNTFGLGKYTAGNLAQENPGATLAGAACNSPRTGGGYPAGSGINSDDVEAAIDIEWATSAAPSASIVNAACASPRGGFGGLLAIQNILNHPNADNVDVISMSYGESEESSGAALNASFNTTFQQAVAAGIGIFVSSGDEDAASSDGGGSTCTGFAAGNDCAKDGITISGWMSSQYDVSVGGLDFADSYLGVTSTYWSTPNNVFYGSAKSYIMEQPWNDSCASTLLASFYTGSPVTYGSTGFCNTATGHGFLLAVGGSGGPSACATGAPAVGGVAGGTCAGYAKPAFQSAYLGSMAGMVNDGVRDTPDVSLMAANGLWGHYYLICYSDTTASGLNNGGTPCTGQPINWPGYGGTSVSSPIMAAIQSLVVQHKGSLQGNPNVRYYALAAAEYGPGGSASCNSALGNGVGNACIFYDVTLGDNIANCQAHSGGTKYNCYLPSGSIGVLSTSNNAYQPAYNTTTGWDFASGIGSVNAYNLVMGY